MSWFPNMYWLVTYSTLYSNCSFILAHVATMCTFLIQTTSTITNLYLLPSSGEGRFLSIIISFLPITAFQLSFYSWKCAYDWSEVEQLSTPWITGGVPPNSEAANIWWSQYQWLGFASDWMMSWKFGRRSPPSNMLCLYTGLFCLERGHFLQCLLTFQVPIEGVQFAMGDWHHHYCDSRVNHPM